MTKFVFEKAYSNHLLLKRLGIFLWDLRIERSLRKGAGVAAGGDWTTKGYLGPEQHQDFEIALEQHFKEVKACVNACMHVALTHKHHNFLQTMTDPPFRFIHATNNTHTHRWIS